VKAPGATPDRWPPSWLAEPETQTLVAAFAAAGLTLRFVGGAVRDALLRLPAGDIDVATPAPPDTVLEALAAAGIKSVPTGLAHGTVTAVIGRRHFEITTLRRDVATDGRHAVVAFDADWNADAARRDFTINAIYLDPDGTLYDPVGGRADLAARRVRFVGDPGQRIAEDVLRLLRYYRFEARYGAGSGDASARAACRAAVPLLPTLSAERVAHELFALLAASDPVRAVRLMQEDGVLAAVLPEATRIDRLESLVEIEASLAAGCDPLRRLAALVAIDPVGASRLAERLRLSVAMRKRLAGLAPPWPAEISAMEQVPPSLPCERGAGTGGPRLPGSDDAGRRMRLALSRLGRERCCDLAMLMAADGRLARERVAELVDYAEAWIAPTFPLSGDDAIALGVARGPRVGRLLNQVREWWETGDFAAGREQCLNRLREIAVNGASNVMS
jgi:poly(A) polymerase